MVDVIHLAETVANIDEFLQHINDIAVRKNAWALIALAAQSTVKLHAPDRRQIVAIF